MFLIVFFIIFVIFITIFLIIFLIVFFIVFVILIFQINDGILFLLILSNQITNILVRLLKLHLVHTFAFVPMQESLSFVHFSKLCANSLKHALDCSRIGNKCAGNCRTLWRNLN